MSLNCIACQQPSSDEQPFYCLHCFIPIPQYQENIYQGNIKVICPNCDAALIQEKCTKCNIIINLEKPPKRQEIDPELFQRQNKRDEITRQLLDGSDQTINMVKTLGIDHLPPVEQGVALTALAKEKINFYSGDYNFVEAHTLADLGHGLTLHVGERWAIHIAATGLAAYYIRAGKPMISVELLHDIYSHAENTTRIQRLRKLEVLAYLALAHRLAGNKLIADEAVSKTLSELNNEYELMEPDITAYLKNEERLSEYIGMNEKTTNFPRVDYIANILVILTEEVFVRGRLGNLLVPEDVLDRLLELDNIIKILGDMTPKDDSGFFAAYIRDYIRLINGIFWYGDILIGNSGNKRRVLLEQIYERIQQWMKIIPIRFWLELKPARFLEVFLRAESWSSKINVEEIILALISNSEKFHRPSFHYVIAEALTNAGKLDQAITHLDKIVSPEGKNVIDSSLKTYAKNLLNSIQLESIGILTGISKENSWLAFPILIQLEAIRRPFEPETYLKEEFKNPVLRLSFDANQKVLQHGIAIFGDKLIEIWKDFLPLIIKVGNRDYDSEKWHSSIQKPGIIVEGVRMDILVIRTIINDINLSLLFEGKPQQINQIKNTFQRLPSDLLILQGIIHFREIKPLQILEFLSDLLTYGKKINYPTDIYVLKSK